METIRLTMARAIVRWLADQRTVIDGTEVTLLAVCQGQEVWRRTSGRRVALGSRRPEVSKRAEVLVARGVYEAESKLRPVGV